MKRLNILLVGEKGYLGSYLQSRLIQDHNVTNDFMALSKFDYIINCVGCTDFNKCESDPRESFASNVIVPQNLMMLHPEAKFIGFSSYYVYDSDGFCTEQSKTTSDYVYMQHKLFSEQVVLTDKKNVVFRLGKLFGTPRPSEVKHERLFEHILLNQELVLDCVHFNPTSLNQVYQVINYELRHRNMTGIFNLSCMGFATPFECGVFIDSVLKSNKKILSVGKIAKTFHNYGKFKMSTRKIQEFIALENWRDEMLKYIRELRLC